MRTRVREFSVACGYIHDAPAILSRRLNLILLAALDVQTFGKRSGNKRDQVKVKQDETGTTEETLPKWKKTRLDGREPVTKQTRANKAGFTLYSC